MNRNFFTKVALVLVVLSWAVYELYPPMNRPLISEFDRLASGYDDTLKGIVEKARELDQASPDRSFHNLLEAVGTNDISRYFPNIPVAGEAEPTRKILTAVQKKAAGQLKLGLDLLGGTSFLVAMDTNAVDVVEGQDHEHFLQQAIEVFRRRLDKFGVAEPVIQPAGNDRILIQMPGLTEDDYLSVKSTIERAAYLEFRMVHPESATLISQSIPEPGYEELPMRVRTRDGKTLYDRILVKRKAEEGLTGEYVDRAGVQPDITGRPEIFLNFNSEGGDKFATVTRNHVNQRLAIVLDGEVYSAPNINTPILNGRAVISGGQGGFDVKEAYELANVLENPLAAPVMIVEERTVDPSLGHDSISSGIWASVIGLVFVTGFMLLYYFGAGLVANIAVCLNVVVLMGVLCNINATLTLPGIAGVVLTIGMAVDANVLIFERIREELLLGKSVRGSLVAGYSKAFSTILDANITTLISSIILIYLGSGPVKGFGVTLTIGICASMFTALFVTRIIFEWLVAKGMIQKFHMLQVIKNPNFDFMGFWKPAFAISWALVIFGTGYGIYRGADILGVDFLGGESLRWRFEQKVDVDKIREAINPITGGDDMVQYQSELVGNVETLLVTVPFDKGNDAMEALSTTFSDAKFDMIAVDKVGPSVGEEILKSAVIAFILAMFGILVYVAFRYEFSFAFGAVIAVLHDVLMTFGWFCLSGREFSAPMVAAVLTIIGFSINDTIVIFDRIREDLKNGAPGSFKDILNGALNKTLSRTIITSGTTLLAALALYLFGGGVINDFAFTFVVGILTGTYSSIFIASPIVLWWTKGHKPKMFESAVTLDPDFSKEVNV